MLSSAQILTCLPLQLLCVLQVGNSRGDNSN